MVRIREDVDTSALSRLTPGIELHGFMNYSLCCGLIINSKREGALKVSLTATFNYLLTIKATDVAANEILIIN